MDWFSDIKHIVDQAADKAHLKPALGAFDGDAWLWIWRPVSREDRTAEARLRVRPDPFNEGVELQVSAAAWMEKRREIAASRVVWSQFVRTAELQKYPNNVVTPLGQNLAIANDFANQLSQRLDDVARERAVLIDTLKKRDLFDGQ
jgi:hypothetical protein